MRQGLHHLGKFAGHDFYRAERFGDNYMGRYLDYNSLMNQYDQLRVTYDEAKAFNEMCLKLSNERKDRELHAHLAIWKAYLEMEINSNIVFESTEKFILIDDEPEDKMSVSHSDLKRKLYKENVEIQLFFCEVFYILQNKPEDYASGYKIWEYLRSRTAQVTELAFSNAIKQASS